MQKCDALKWQIILKRGKYENKGIQLSWFEENDFNSSKTTKSSANRFVEVLSLSQNFKNIWQFLGASLAFDNILSLIWHQIYALNSKWTDTELIIFASGHTDLGVW